MSVKNSFTVLHASCRPGPSIAHLETQYSWAQIRLAATSLGSRPTGMEAPRSRCWEPTYTSWAMNRPVSLQCRDSFGDIFTLTSGVEPTATAILTFTHTTYPLRELIVRGPSTRYTRIHWRRTRCYPILKTAILLREQILRTGYAQGTELHSGSRPHPGRRQSQYSWAHMDPSAHSLAFRGGGMVRRMPIVLLEANRYRVHPEHIRSAKWSRRAQLPTPRTRQVRCSR